MRPDLGRLVRAPRRSGGLYIARLAGDTGVGTLLEALDLFPGARIDVLGTGPQADRLQAHPCVRLAGTWGHFERCRRMRNAAYLVVPADGPEPLPQALIEAFANALPVIAARSDALAELVEPGRNGLLFEPGSARELARRLAWAEAFPEKMLQMGECAKADYDARFLADWSHPRLFGERRRIARHAG
jgi:glycosyltransferase involved in cell wall biosynthesis